MSFMAVLIRVISRSGVGLSVQVVEIQGDFLLMGHGMFLVKHLASA